VKGFAGGFGERARQPWGEEVLKHFVSESIHEALKLESALAKVHVPWRNCAHAPCPVVGTTEGEPPEIIPFLGSSRLEDPSNRYPLLAAFHGHAHHGSPEARMKDDVPVYNVALPFLQRTFPGRPPIRILDVPSMVPV
jgi:hypothetical protein